MNITIKHFNPETGLLNYSREDENSSVGYVGLVNNFFKKIITFSQRTILYKDVVKEDLEKFIGFKLEKVMSK